MSPGLGVVQLGVNVVCSGAELSCAAFEPVDRRLLPSSRSHTVPSNRIIPVTDSLCCSQGSLRSAMTVASCDHKYDAFPVKVPDQQLKGESECQRFGETKLGGRSAGSRASTCHCASRKGCAKWRNSKRFRKGCGGRSCHRNNHWFRLARALRSARPPAQWQANVPQKSREERPAASGSADYKAQLQQQNQATAQYQQQLSSSKRAFSACTDARGCRVQ